MFETDLDESISEGYIRRFTEKYFPVLIIKKPDYLLIEDRRIDPMMFLPLFFGALVLTILGLLALFAFSAIFVFVLVVLLSVLVVFLFYIFLSTSFRQRAIFSKEKDFYEITRNNFLKTETIKGKVSDIKEVKIEIYWSETEEGARTFTSTSYLIPKDVILNDLRHQTLERNTFNNDYRTTTKIVFAVTDYLGIPYSEEEFQKS